MEETLNEKVTQVVNVRQTENDLELEVFPSLKKKGVYIRELDHGLTSTIEL